MDSLARHIGETTVHMRGGPKSRDNLLTALAILLAVFSLIMAYQIFFSQSEPQNPIQSDPIVEGAKWSCTKVVCERQMSQQEWFDRFCSADGKGGAGCRFQTPEGVVVLPLSQLNLSAIRECAQYRCVEESLIRPANHSILPP